VWRAGLLLVATLATVAHADDPRDAFGFKKRPPKPGSEPLDCSDGRAFGCTGASDPLDETASPYALSSWLSSSYLLSLPVADATHDAVPPHAPGSSRPTAGVRLARPPGP